MNTFGRIFRVSVFGESHGPCVGVTIDGVPAGIALAQQDFEADILRRKGGLQKGTTPRSEDDVPEIKSGLFNGFTTGAPLTILFENKNTRSADYERHRAIPRPGHADWVAQQKYGGFEDFRGSGHFSARITVGIVAAGVVAKKILQPLHIQARITSIAGEKDLDKGLQRGIDAKDSVGGIIECTATGLPAGLGEPFWDSLESQLAHAMFAIPAVKGIQFGAGFAAATMFGSEHNDAIVDKDGTTATNHAGGVVGGISNGNPLVFSIAVKPTSSTPRLQESINLESGQVESFSVKGRHDLCVALRAPVIVEAMTALVLADCMFIRRSQQRTATPMSEAL
jgi:chorismate synthase